MSRIYQRISWSIVLLTIVFSVACESHPLDSKRLAVDKIVIVKSDHTLTLLHAGKEIKTYKVSIGRVPVGPKERAGDHKTPEGKYIIDAKNPNSKFHLALHISYPNADDRARAARLGVDPGGEIEIHGLENGLGWIGPLQRETDWTDGCIALTDSEIEEVYPAVRVGTPVEILP
jgi:murein L,D-transpeptidase YafK